VLTVGVLTWLGALHWLRSEPALQARASRTTVHGASERVAPEAPRADVGVVQADAGPAARSAPSADVSKPAVVVAKVRKRSSVPAPLLAASISNSPERELELLRKAQEVLHRFPAVSEARLAEHARDYPHGVFEQEREMLRIELALARGERVRARELAQKFMTRFAGSTYQRRLEMLLAPNIAQEDRRDVDTQSMDTTNN
jgi:hypothetical protein